MERMMFLEDKATGVGLTGFKEFLKKQDPDAKYNWVDSQNCACAQYLKSVEQFQSDWLKANIPGDVEQKFSDKDEVMRKLNRIAGEGDSRCITDEYGMFIGRDSHDWTFGECLKRCEKLETV